MDDFKPNSHRFRAQESSQQLTQEDSEHKVEKVVKGRVTVKPKKTGIFSELFNRENISSMGEYLTKDVFAPLIRKAIDDTVHTMLYGETRPAGKKGSGSRISYGSYYDKRDDRDDRPRRTYRANDGFGLDDIYLETRGDAEEILIQIDELIDRFGKASVGDFYDLMGERCPSHSGNRYGWTDFVGREANVRQTRQGDYRLIMPRPTVL